MKTSKYYKQMKAVMIATVVASLFWLYWTVGRTINTTINIKETKLLNLAISYRLYTAATAVTITEI